MSGPRQERLCAPPFETPSQLLAVSLNAEVAHGFVATDFGVRPMKEDTIDAPNTDLGLLFTARGEPPHWEPAGEESGSKCTPSKAGSRTKLLSARSTVKLGASFLSVSSSSSSSSSLPPPGDSLPDELDAGAGVPKPSGGQRASKAPLKASRLEHTIRARNTSLGPGGSFASEDSAAVCRKPAAAKAPLPAAVAPGLFFVQGSSSDFGGAAARIMSSRERSRNSWITAPSGSLASSRARSTGCSLFALPQSSR
mmetsp:Transcript_13500/g.36423  ORF Transcript_13500/g.36423 Transcript_13500/m.36423 type:complete len:253 (+) Transcript_13500:403-1161(+)